MKKITVLLCPLLLASVALLNAQERGDDQGWTRLFNGKNLEGWKANERPEQWKVEDGAIVAHGERSHLFYVGDDDYRNFHLKMDVMTKPGSNSGIYFATKYQPEGWPEQGYESQVNISQGDPVKTGSLYNVVKIFNPPAEDNKWWTQEIIVQGNRITTKIDGKVLYEYVEPEGVEGPRRLQPGTFALQAHDPGSTAYFKNIMVKRLDEPRR